MATGDTAIRPEIESVLSRLRSKIRTYVFLEGTAWVIVALGAVFWITLAVNWAYFKVSNLELPVWFRLLVDVAAIGFLAACLMLWLIQRLLKNMRTKALALVLERRFPELDDRLITAVEAAESATGRETFFTTTLLNRTIADVTEATRRLEVTDVFAKKPLRNAMLMAVVFTASIIGFGMLNQEALGYWYKAYFGLREEYWDRETLLVPKVVSPADDRIKSFREIDGELVYKHPRGEDFILSVTVPDDKRPDGEEWIVPGEVEWDYELENDRGGARSPMNKTGEREFQYTIPGLIDGMTFTIKGNDYINRRPYRVEIVDPPNIKQMVLDCAYPDYTGLNPEFLPDPGESPSNIKVVDGSQIIEPMETEILMQATTNKPLVGLRVEGQNFRLTVKSERKSDDGETLPAFSKLELLAHDGAPLFELPLAKGFGEQVLVDPEASFARIMKHDANSDKKLSRTEAQDTLLAQFAGMDANKDELLDETELHGYCSRIFSLPVKLATDAPLRFTPPGLPLAADWSKGLLLNPFLQVADAAAWASEPLSALPLTSNTVLRIFLEDTDDVFSSEPAQITINGVIDLPPVQTVECFGIGDYITPNATIPVRGKITDDYGVAEARFEYQLTTEAGQVLTGPGWMAAEFDTPPANEPKEYVLKRENGTPDISDDVMFDQFDVTKILFQDAAGPRSISVGDVLVLTIYSEDGDNINGPHIVRQKPKPEYVFKVVSSDELLAILYQKELGLLSRFIQIISEVEKVKEDLVKAQAELAALTALKQKDPNLVLEDQNEFKSVEATSTRSIQQAAKNLSETRAVEMSWREIVAELGNNRIETAQMVDSLNRLIIDPMKQISDRDFKNLVGSLDQFKLAHAGGQSSADDIQKCLNDVTTLLEHMQQVKKEMEDLIGFQQLPRALMEIMQGTEEAKKQTEKENLNQLEKLKLLD